VMASVRMSSASIELPVHDVLRLENASRAPKSPNSRVSRAKSK